MVASLQSKEGDMRKTLHHHVPLQSGDYPSPAALAHKLGFSRARVTKVLHLLSLTPEVQQQLMALGDPLSSPLITERKLRPVVYLSPEEQQCWASIVLQSSGKLRWMTGGSHITE